MRRASVVASAAISPLGAGDDATAHGGVGAPPKIALREDETFVRAGLVRPFAARIDRREVAAHPELEDLATALVWTVTERCLALARASIPRGARIGLALGTSSGAMSGAEELFRRRASGAEIDARTAARATYFAPWQEVVERLGHQDITLTRTAHLVTACAASTWALGVGLRWLQANEADVVFAGGYDALTVFVASGFECLRATTASRPAPFALARDGMSLGEGAAVCALVREGEEAGRPVRFFVSGFGASTDAVHITAPDRTGDGLYRAGALAMKDARVPADRIGVVSAHATATPYNDAMEWKAISRLLPDASVYLHPFKSQIGHTLGAAGVLETLALGHAIAAKVAPAAATFGDLDPETPASLSPITTRLKEKQSAGLKLSAAFGGANAALVVEAPDALPDVLLDALPGVEPRGPVVHRAWLSASFSTVSPDAAMIARAGGSQRDKVDRCDSMSLLLSTAIAGLLELRGRPFPPDTGLLVSHGLATVDLNERFNARILTRGARFAEPRLFPPTSPNLMPGQAAIFFGLTGPTAALAGGPGQGLAAVSLARTLLRSGDCAAIVVASVDELGELSRLMIELGFPAVSDITQGATACLVEASDVAPGADARELSEDIPSRGFGRGALEAWCAER